MRRGPTGKLRTPELPRAEAADARDLAVHALDWWFGCTWLPSVNGGFKADSQALLNRHGSSCFLGNIDATTSCSYGATAADLLQESRVAFPVRPLKKSIRETDNGRLRK